jgi:hypothetical protein
MKEPTMPSRPHDRYRLRQEGDGSWTIYDIFTGLPAIVAARELSNLEIRNADETNELLNKYDLERRQALGISN